MKSYLSFLELPGSLAKGCNPMPVFRAPSGPAVESDGTLGEEELYLLGDYAGYRALPYKIQDRYDRDLKTVQLKTAVLENDLMRAEFLPEQGGRLYSLINKETGNDVFFKNPVYRLSNLAILDAWFSGGVEWNIGQFGHTFSTNSPVFFARVREGSYEFLRMYDYERCKKVFYQIDFHLPQGSRVLYAYVRIINDDNYKKPMYWWTNAALPEKNNIRVFSGTDEVMYLNTETTPEGRKQIFAGHARLPVLPALPDADSSYPLNSDYSNEFFFQNSKREATTWSAAAYNDGTLYFNRATQPLRFHKMFCWGSHRGGRKWCEYLSLPGKAGEYIELQAGLAPSQLNGMDIEAGSAISFTQAFGETVCGDRNELYDTDWRKSRDYAEAQIAAAFPADDLLDSQVRFEKLAGHEITEILSMGTGWGALEQMRREKCGEKAIPSGLLFPEASVGREQYCWHALLNNGIFPDADAYSIPSSWMIDEKWMALLENSIRLPYGDNAMARLHLGVMKYEALDFDGAISEWEKSLAKKETAWSFRNLAVSESCKGNSTKASAYMQAAVNLENNSIDIAFTEEYFDLLGETGEYRTIWEKYSELPDERKQDECILMKTGRAAFELGEYAFVEKLLSRDFTHIREGDNLLVDLWFRYETQKEAVKRGILVTDELYKEIRADRLPPANIDFRMADR